jgi:hypothetical protein
LRVSNPTANRRRTDADLGQHTGEVFNNAVGGLGRQQMRQQTGPPGQSTDLPFRRWKRWSSAEHTQ